jgi:type IV pilus assembly protein PilC
MALEDWLLQRARVSSKRHKKITLDDKMTLFQQLASLVASGVPLLQAIQMSAQQSQSHRMRDVLEDVSARVASGSALNAALMNHPRVFEDHWIALIGTGEVSGKMEQVLNDLNEQIRETQETRRKITGALIYPVILLLVAVVVIVIMLWFVVPTFESMFSEMGAELPGITQTVLAMSDYVVAYGLYAAVGVVVLVFLFRRYIRTDNGCRRVGAMALATPLFGELVVQSSMYRFASNFSLLLKSGVPMMDALDSLSGVFRGSPAYRDAILTAQNRVAAGRSLADSLEESGLFTTMITNMVRVGEESASLANVMAQIAPYYKEKMNSFLSKVTKLLEPCIIMAMGFTIAVMMLAIYLPMFEMAGKVN